MKTFKLYWLIGQDEIVKGNDIEEALENANYVEIKEVVEYNK